MAIRDWVQQRVNRARQRATNKAISAVLELLVLIVELQEEHMVSEAQALADLQAAVTDIGTALDDDTTEILDAVQIIQGDPANAAAVETAAQAIAAAASRVKANTQSIKDAITPPTPAPMPSTLVITAVTPAAGQVGVAYSQALTATGGTAPYSWTVSAGTLPSGLALDPASGAISGTPNASGASTFTVSVTDSATPAASATLDLSISVA